MAFVFSILFTGMIAVGLYRFVTRAETRRSFIQDCKNDPLVAAFVVAWTGFWMAFFWGIFIPAFGRLPLLGLEVWQVGGLGSLVGLVLAFSVPRLRGY